MYKQAFKRYKSLNFIGNSISILTASDGIASAVATGCISLIAISTVSLLRKGYMEHQSLNLKIQNCQYAFQSSNHLLILIKDAMRSGNFNEEALINSMNNVDNYVTDNSPIGPLQDPVTWYGINYAGTQMTQWDFQNKGKSGWTGTSSFVLEVPLRHLRPSVIYSVPCDRILQRAYC